MRIPDALQPLVDYGIVQDVVRPLMSGKEAQVYVVIADGRYCVAKVYKDAQHRTFKHRAAYTEGRKVRNSRDQRAIASRSKHGRAQDEAAWRSTEVDMIHRLHAAGVRVPTPYHFIEGVLLMEIILDAEGQPAPRLADVVFDPAGAQAMYDRLIVEVQRMLCAGVVHGDFSDFNVLVSADGPVIIDFPQSVDTAANANARKLLIRDVDNMHRFLAQFVPNARRLPYAEEMWELFQQNAITPDTRLTGRYRPSERRANTHEVLELIRDANYDERKRREQLGLRGGPPVTRDAPRTAPMQGAQASSWRGPPRQTNRQEPRRDGPRHEPPRGGPSRNGPPQDRPRPGSVPPNDNRGPHPNASGGAPPHSSGTQGSRSSANGGRRERARPIEVIVARRPSGR
jgi:RIO kinase 1